MRGETTIWVIGCLAVGVLMSRTLGCVDRAIERKRSAKQQIEQTVAESAEKRYQGRAAEFEEAAARRVFVRFVEKAQTCGGDGTRSDGRRFAVIRSEDITLEHSTVQEAIGKVLVIGIDVECSKAVMDALLEDSSGALVGGISGAGEEAGKKVFHGADYSTKEVAR